MRIPFFVFGIYSRLLNSIVPVKKKTWAFGADYGQSYRESSKYILEYMLKEHSDYDCFFITRNIDVYNVLKRKGIPCYMNTSFSGIYHLASAECIFMTQYIIDILFAYKKKNRKFFYIGHGMPFKKAFKALPNYCFSEKRKRLLAPLLNYLTCGYDFDESIFAISTSDFLTPYIKEYYGDNMPVKVIGFPRNDALFDKERMSSEKWISGVDKKFIVTYMPTHRDGGKGKLSPNPFRNRPDIQKWMKENNVVLLIKQHPNMINRLEDTENTDTIKDITKMKIDSQVCLYHTDVLISDFSSVWIDFLLLKRPLIFYYYDDYVNKDWGQLYDIKEDFSRYFSYSTDELFELLKSIRENYDLMRPSDMVVHKYHKYVDDKSSKRFYEEVRSIN